jgi:hypothetical protein
MGIFLDYLYDFFTLVLACLDIVTDLLVCQEFYENGENVFFVTCAAILCIAGISFSALFCTLFASGKSDGKKALIFLLVLPISPLVPAIVWILSFQIPWLDDFWRNTLGFREMDMSIYSANKDPVKLYLMRKLISHGGFMCESLVEAVPQSILQMVAIVSLNRSPSFVNVLSICLSIGSVVSKGTLAY